MRTQEVIREQVRYCSECGRYRVPVSGGGRALAHRNPALGDWCIGQGDVLPLVPVSRVVTFTRV